MGLFPKPVSVILTSSGSANPNQRGEIQVLGSSGVTISASGNALFIDNERAQGVLTLSGNSGGPIFPSMGNISIEGRGGVSVSGEGNTLEVSYAQGGINWSDNATSGPLSVNSGYIVTGGEQTFTMPSTSDIGDVIFMVLNGGVRFRITLQGNILKGIGPGGGALSYSTSVSSNNPDNTVLKMLCIRGSAQWTIESLIGSLMGS